MKINSFMSKCIIYKYKYQYNNNKIIIVLIVNIHVPVSCPVRINCYIKLQAAAADI